MKEMVINKIDDFEINGFGSNKSWEKIPWTDLVTIGKASLKYSTRVKLQWSDKGLYFLFYCEDEKLTCTKTNHFEEIYLEDVVEVFLWPDEGQFSYFEYEISPLGMELPLLVINNQGSFHGWLPFLYKGNRKIESATQIIGGEKKPMAEAQAWIAEFFIPYELIKGLLNNPPQCGTVWRANMVRMDYESSPKTQWSWCDDDALVDDFHNFNHYGKLIFAE
ncbi:MAG: carbohydrate-binding family 9-like protein [Spirochaetales bacterium]|nr:carbohydrate-binding family 9-like protein [Spirochaetales bacterium]